MTGSSRVDADGVIHLRVDGKPMGWQRTRTNFAQRRHFNDAKTERGEANVILAWIAAGEPRLGHGPVALTVEVVLERPAGHWKKDGTLSAAGQRMPWPLKKPDFDNVAKLIGDAMNGRAYHDDAHIVRGVQIKRWANPGEHEHTAVRVWSVLTPVGD